MIINGNELKAEKGMKLTNGHTFGDTVSLSEFDSTDNWHEITDEQVQELMEENHETEIGGDFNG